MRTTGIRGAGSLWFMQHVPHELCVTSVPRRETEIHSKDVDGHSCVTCATGHCVRHQGAIQESTIMRYIVVTQLLKT